MTVKPQRRHGGKLKVTGEHMETLDLALRIGIEEGRTMIEAWKGEMEMVQACIDCPETPPAVVEKGLVYKAALHNLINATAGVIAKYQSALCATDRGAL